MLFSGLHTGNSSMPPRKNEGKALSLVRQRDSVSVRRTQSWSSRQHGMTPSTPAPRQGAFRVAHCDVATHGLRLRVHISPSSVAFAIADTIACAVATRMRSVTPRSKSCAKFVMSPAPTANQTLCVSACCELQLTQRRGTYQESHASGIRNILTQASA